jgi:hypothetical protein
MFARSSAGVKEEDGRCETTLSSPDLPPAPLAAAHNLLAALFLGLAVAAILRDINDAKTITLDSLCGALAGYLLVSVIFYHLSSMLELVRPGSVQGGPDVLKELADADRCHSVLAYFSMVTMTTVAYGEVVPASRAARTLACLEALAGQLCMAVILAELIGLKASQGADGTAGKGLSETPLAAPSVGAVSGTGRRSHRLSTGRPPKLRLSEPTCLLFAPPRLPLPVQLAHTA